MSEDLLSPIAPRNPAQQIHADPSKVGSIQIAQNQSESEQYIEGAEKIYLPSRGVFYTQDQRYLNMDTLLVRQLNYTDEDILTTKSYFDNGTIFNELLKNVIVDPNQFPATALMPVDRDTILIWLRSTAFGNDFEIEYKCSNPTCGHLFPVKWDLGTLAVPEYDEEIYEELKKNGEYRIETPIKKLGVRLTLPSVGKSLEAERMLQQKKLAKKTTQDFFGTGSLRLIVAGIEAEGNKIIRKGDEVMNYFTKIQLPISDARYIRKQAEKINLKYDTKQTVSCPNCSGVEEDVEMPVLHPNFLWLQP
jgi:hypothetical protein